MHVLIVYAHPSPKSFCHAALDEFTRGLQDVGQIRMCLTSMKFDPVFTSADMTKRAHELGRAFSPAVARAASTFTQAALS